MAYGQGFEAHVADETALIVYDSATQTEHFLRLAKFEGASADFGFFVPTPSQPELAEGSADIFPMLAKLTEPVTVYRTKYEEVGPGCGFAAKSPDAMSASGNSMPAGVRVVERKRVGAFDAAVLKAESAKTLQDWLKENEYTSRPALEAWFGEYIRLGWYITAFKIAGGASTASVNTPVRISFKTDVPVYPYREPVDQNPKDKWSRRLLRLFVLSDARVDGKLGRDGKSFAGETVWSKPIAAGAIAPALDAGKFPVLNRDWHLTEFEDHSSPRDGSDDVYFPKANNQNPVERPPHEIVTVKDSYWGVGICGLIAFALPTVAIFGLIRLLRPAR